MTGSRNDGARPFGRAGYWIPSIRAITDKGNGVRLRPCDPLIPANAGTQLRAPECGQDSKI
jgi:hypothetical protein